MSAPVLDWELLLSHDYNAPSASNRSRRPSAGPAAAQQADRPLAVPLNGLSLRFKDGEVEHRFWDSPRVRRQLAHLDCSAMPLVIACNA